MEKDKTKASPQTYLQRGLLTIWEMTTYTQQTERLLIFGTPIPQHFFQIPQGFIIHIAVIQQCAENTPHGLSLGLFIGGHGLDLLRCILGLAESRCIGPAIMAAHLLKSGHFHSALFQHAVEQNMNRTVFPALFLGILQNFCP